MHDWNRDGKEDYWDDIYFHETFERDNGIDDDEDDDDYDYDEYTGIRSNRTYNQSYSSNRYKSTGVPFIVRLIIGVIYQLVSRCHCNREDKIRMVDDILSKLNYDLSVDGKNIFKFMEDLHGEETSMLAAMAHFYTDIDNNNPLGWIIVYRMSGSYNYQTHKPIHSLEEATNFMIGMDNYLNKTYPMRGYGRIAVEYLKRVGEYIKKDMEENVTFE